MSPPGCAQAAVVGSPRDDAGFPRALRGGEERDGRRWEPATPAGLRSWGGRGPPPGPLRLHCRRPRRTGGLRRRASLGLRACGVWARTPALPRAVSWGRAARPEPRSF